MNNIIDYDECLYSKSIQLCKNIQKQLITLEKELENIKNKDKKKPIPPADCSFPPKTESLILS